MILKPLSAFLLWRLLCRHFAGNLLADVSYDTVNRAKFGSNYFPFVEMAPNELQICAGATGPKYY